MVGSFTCRKVGTWDRLFNFPSEGRHAEGFYEQKNPTASARFEPATEGKLREYLNEWSLCCSLMVLERVSE
jgi:hypothetical protein